MTIVKAQVRFDEAVTSDVVADAIKRGRKRASTGVHATSVQYLVSLESLLVGFADQSAVALPIKNYPELAALTESELKALTLGFGGSALCLKSRDLHVSIAGLVSVSRPLMNLAATVIASRNGSKSTLVKAQAARENGKSGGRPRLVRTSVEPV